MRNSLFGVMDIIIVNHLSGEDLNEEQRTLRDECLEDLWTHMNDANSYARSKVIIMIFILHLLCTINDRSDELVVSVTFKLYL